MIDCKCGKDQHKNCKPFDENAVVAALAKQICDEIDNDIIAQITGQYDNERKLKDLFGLQ